MDKFIAFMENRTCFELSCGTFYNSGGQIIFELDLNHRRYKIKDGSDLQDLIYDQDLPFRVCMECGQPMEDGYTDELGRTYFCCKEEFKTDMDMRYGHENWRAEPSGKKEWYYEYRDNANAEWLPEHSFWTSWT